jgi:mRNA-degrading endonuclease RelE of RelBE toxin-antitoxin system
MKLDYTKRARGALSDLPAFVRKAFYKQAGLLAQNLQYPSLHAKKYDESNNIWQARINRDWRFYFMIEGDTCTITNVTRHPK